MKLKEKRQPVTTTGEDTTSNNGLTKNSPFEYLMCERIQVISRLKLLAGTNPELFKISEIEADGLMKSDESELKDQIREELKKARLLLRKKFPLRYYLKVLKALWPK